MRYPEAAECPLHYPYRNLAHFETLSRWLTSKGQVLLGVDPVHQAPVNDHFSELIHVLGGSSPNIKSSTLEINSQVTITNWSGDFLHHIETLTVRHGPCFNAEDCYTTRRLNSMYD